MYLYTAQGQYVEYFASNKRCEDATGRQDCSSQDDCKWENEECVAKCDSFNKERCGFYQSCKWNDQRSRCDFKQRNCSALPKKDCNDQYDCKWLRDECVPNCNTFERARCETTPLCEWNNKDCFFKHAKCSDTSTEECNKHSECAWKSDECVPRCDMFDKNSCESYKACGWDPKSNSCNIANRSCGRIDTEQDCTKYTECAWKNEGCAPRCNMFDKAKCDSYKDCIWDPNRNVCGFKDT